MKQVWWFLAGVGAAAALAQLASWRMGRAISATLDINECNREDLLRLPDVDDDLAERILENRPYRSKYDLLNRLVVPAAVYRGIGHRISVSDHAAHDAIRTA